jgi:hypothetical protein
MIQTQILSNGCTPCQSPMSSPYYYAFGKGIGGGSFYCGLT